MKSAAGLSSHRTIRIMSLIPTLLQAPGVHRLVHRAGVEFVRAA